MKRFNDYDSIAAVYDLLGRLVYGGQLKQSQLELLPLLPKGKQVLIIGGGTGWIINEVMRVCEPDQIIYLEKSAKMIARSKETCLDAYRDRVRFICGTQDDLESEYRFDIIVTNYFFDQFTFYRLSKILRQLHDHAAEDAYWHWSDFIQPIKWKHRFLMRLMLIFFSLSTKLATQQIYDLYPIFTKWGWQLVEKKAFYDGFMESAVFKRIAK